MAKKKARNRSGETSVADCINESNGHGHDHPAQIPPKDRPNFYIVSEQSRKMFAWIIGICTGSMALLTIYTSVIRDDQTQAINIKMLQTEQATIKVTIKEHYQLTQAQIKEASKVPIENAKSLQRLETMQAVLLQRSQ